MQRYILDHKVGMSNFGISPFSIQTYISFLRQKLMVKYADFSKSFYHHLISLDKCSTVGNGDDSR